MKRILISAIFIMTVCAAALAQTETPRANTRQKAQRAFIADGRQDGELTNKEARR